LVAWCRGDNLFFFFFFFFFFSVDQVYFWLGFSLVGILVLVLVLGFFFSYHWCGEHGFYWCHFLCSSMTGVVVPVSASKKKHSLLLY
jgi:hypothetical protein